MSQDTLAEKSENDGIPPAKIPELKIEDESAFVLPYMSSTCCSAPAAVPLEVETSSCSRPHIKESIFDLQRRIHFEKDVQESVLFSPEIMENIFHMLNLAEQNRFRLVCKQWNKMAHEYWSESSFNCREKIEPLKRMNVRNLDCWFDFFLSLIKERPLLKSITCNLDDGGQNSEVIEVVLLYVEDLRHIDLSYSTSSQVKSLVNKFKELKSVILQVTNPNLVECVKCFGNSENLEDLTLSKKSDSKDDHVKRNFAAVCRAIAENYPGLKRLSLMPIVSLKMCKQLEYLLQKRSTSFSHLYLVLHKYSNGTGNVLGLCANLEVLRLELHSPDTPFQISGLSKLKELWIHFEGSYTNKVAVKTLHSIQVNCPQIHELYLFLEFSASEDLPLSTSYRETVRTPRLRVFDKSTSMNELNDISKMKNISHISIIGRYISENITMSIAKRRSLEFLAFDHCTVAEPALLELKRCTSLKALLFVNTKLTLNGIIQVVKSLPNMKIHYVPKCAASSLDILRDVSLLRKH